MFRPRPVPPCPRRVVKKGSKMRSSTSGAMPLPLSVTCSLDHLAVLRRADHDAARRVGFKGMLDAVQRQVGDDLGKGARIAVEHDVGRAVELTGDRVFFSLGCRLDTTSSI
jgi:hypothetical protein